ncbi:hypothetical protein J22TS1_21150 [Siminovitchia terrae]|uniref:hypothetical protein n=1 Tax=Siminovitchia terrae TaxID=1914933 RepID=UPI001AFFC191|nr:hypothetical protein [Siminovitchia terrae]GIN91064.1 hypothetical protein J22TS1_21150 [Siminovitchia terrae]
MNAYWCSIQWGFKPRLNKVKASSGCHRSSGEIYRAELDKIWAQIHQGAFDFFIEKDIGSMESEWINKIKKEFIYESTSECGYQI